MVAHGAKGMFQIGVRSGEDQTHCSERKAPPNSYQSPMPKGCGHLPKRLRSICFLSHLIEQGLLLLLHFPSRVLVRIGEEVCSPMRTHAYPAWTSGHSSAVAVSPFVSNGEPTIAECLVQFR